MALKKLLCSRPEDGLWCRLGVKLPLKLKLICYRHEYGLSCQHGVKHWHTVRITDLISNWLTDWLTDWLIDWFTLHVTLNIRLHQSMPNSEEGILRHGIKYWLKCKDSTNIICTHEPLILWSKLLPTSTNYSLTYAAPCMRGAHGCQGLSTSLTQDPGKMRNSHHVDTPFTFLNLLKLHMDSVCNLDEAAGSVLATVPSAPWYLDFSSKLGGRGSGRTPLVMPFWGPGWPGEQGILTPTVNNEQQIDQSAPTTSHIRQERQSESVFRLRKHHKLLSEYMVPLCLRLPWDSCLSWAVYKYSVWDAVGWTINWHF